MLLFLTVWTIGGCDRRTPPMNPAVPVGSNRESLDRREGNFLRLKNDTPLSGLNLADFKKTVSCLFSCFDGSLDRMHLFLNHLHRLYWNPPGETESGSAGVQPDKG